MWEVQREGDGEVGGTEGEMVMWDVERESDGEVGGTEGGRW